MAIRQIEVDDLSEGSLGHTVANQGKLIVGETNGHIVLSIRGDSTCEVGYFDLKCAIEAVWRSSDVKVK